ncbi:hypothetical protein IMZ48_07910 [Candidatus Bathyarchaeota archaeon]|nr:hypothetical protein [Candidatus Bathyarchaeota archaeon]
MIPGIDVLGHLCRDPDMRHYRQEAENPPPGPALHWNRSAARTSTA